ncbi:iron-sulfur protein [Planobispora rosea]|uniref:Cytochrome bc1 complex Rieske iron-sulfur subunit n=2 Tax=Planobispora rosea TaxID=35762 RepID=A0A8J3S4I7_PLARO|nr:iron-sulfur protein [Planobispora rosea]GIH83428.1 iron-sulfur protein [Planobispora rosea]
MLGAGGVGLAAALTACSGYGQPAAEETTSAEPAPSSAPETASGSGSGDSAANALAKTGDIPEGGGKVFKAEKVVVTQPTAGEFKCFSSVCTHQGCDVDAVEGGTINCPCHGSKFSIADGSVTDGPAKKPLPEKTIKVDGESITLA